MTAPISNGPATTRLHHYAGHYSQRLLDSQCGLVHGKSMCHITSNMIDTPLAIISLAHETYNDMQTILQNVIPLVTHMKNPKNT